MSLLDDSELVGTLRNACHEHGVALCYLFGSQASELVDRFSDVDVGVVFAEKQEGDELVRRWIALHKELAPLFLPTELDLVNLDEVSLEVMFSAMAEGTLVFCADEVFRANFEERVSREWHDFEPVVRAFNRDLATGILEEAARAGR